MPGPCLSALIGFNGPMVGTFHASGELLHMWTRPALKSSMARLSSRVVVSESALETARANWYDAEYVVLWNGIEVDRCAAAVPTPTDRPAAFFIGRHEPRKGLAVLLDAWRTLDRDAVLWVGGAGPQTDELRAETAGANVEWLGAITDAERDSRLRGATVLCAPSLHGESFGVVLLEGMARSHKRWHGSTQQLMVRLSRSRLERIVASETGIGIGDPLNFGVMQVLDLARVSTLWNYIVTICRDLNDPHPCFDGHLGRLAERTLSLLLLNAVPNNYKWAFAEEQLSSAAPYYVRRVENYIREHASEQITTDDLVLVGGVSARSIYHGFSRFRSITPMGYLKAVRLDLARDVLIKGRRAGANSVTQAATAAGYTNLSKFSRDYKARFRESPSQTLAVA